MSGKEKTASYDLLDAHPCDPCRTLFENQESVGQLHEARGSQRRPDWGAQPWGIIQLVALPLRAPEDRWLSRLPSQPGRGAAHVCSSEPGEGPVLGSEQVKLNLMNWTTCPTRFSSDRLLCVPVGN